MGLINYTISTPLTSGNAKVEMLDNILTFSLDNSWYVYDKPEYITSFSKDILTTPFDSILIGGLGLGLIPYYISNNFGGKDIDVLENNTGVIDIISQMGYLHPSINIIEADALTYTTEKQYDLILMDLWWDEDSTFLEQKTITLSNYSSNLTPTGTFYFPISPE